MLPYTVANVLARMVFEGALDVDDVTEIWQDLAAVDLKLHPSNLASEGPEIAAITVQLRRRHATDGSRKRGAPAARSVVPAGVGNLDHFLRALRADRPGDHLVHLRVGGLLLGDSLLSLTDRRLRVGAPLRRAGQAAKLGAKA